MPFFSCLACSRSRSEQALAFRNRLFSRGRFLNWQFLKHLSGVKMRTFCIFAVVLTFLGAVSARSYAVIVDLTITGSFVAADYDVSSTGPDIPVGDPEGDDDLVFGTAPSNGSTTFTVRVNTNGSSFFPMGYLSNGTDALLHDWYGYTDVTLLGPHTFGSATWEPSGVNTALVGPDGTTATLWTDADIATTDPSLVSIIMNGTGDDLRAQLSFGPRFTTNITDRFSISEFFGGEFIASNTYAASAVVFRIPEPSTALMLIVGILMVNFSQRKSVELSQSFTEWPS